MCGLCCARGPSPCARRERSLPVPRLRAPEPLLQALGETPGKLPEREALGRTARGSWRVRLVYLSDDEREELKRAYIADPTGPAALGVPARRASAPTT